MTRAQALGAPVFRRVRELERTPELERLAAQFLEDHGDAAAGTELAFELGGRSYFARIEEQYHEPGGARRPWGYHSGVSLFVFVEVGSDEPVYDGRGSAQ